MIKIITGHYGSGKTEFSVHFAISLSKLNKRVALVDLDIVNPYFRSREKNMLLNNYGIQVIGSSIGDSNIAADLPAIPAEANFFLESQDYITILDVGGNAEGARVLSRFSKKIKKQNYDMYIVINANRPQTSDLENVQNMIYNIEAVSGLQVNGLINNTHMLKETAEKDILKGFDLCQKVSREMDIPIIYNVIPEYLNSKINHNVIDKIFIIDQLYLRPNWL